MIDLAQVSIQLVISFIPATTLFYLLRLSVINEPYSFRLDHRKTVSNALGEDIRLKFIIMSLFLFFQTVVVSVFSPDAFVFVFVVTIVIVNITAIFCLLTNYPEADYLIALLRKERGLDRAEVVEKDVDRFIYEKATGRELIDEEEGVIERRSEEKRSFFRYISVFILIVFPIFSIAWIYFQQEDALVNYICESGFREIGNKVIDSVLVFSLSNYGLGIKCPEGKICSKEVYKFLQVFNGDLYRGVLFIYFISITYPIIRFVFSLKEYRALLYEGNTSNLGLETDVVQTLGLTGSIFFSSFISLLLIQVPVAELGLFSGLVVAGLSLALRDTLGNLMAGALLIWDGSLKKGDVITIPQTDASDTGSTYGIIKEMKMRYTVVEDRNTVRRLVPNSLLVSEPIESWTHEGNRVRLSLNVGVSYGTDLPKAKQIMESVCYDVSRIINSKPPQALVVNFGDSSIDFSLRFWLRDTNSGIRPVISEVLMGIKQRFDDEGIEIPFPQQEVSFKNEEVRNIANAGTRRILQMLSR